MKLNIFITLLCMYGGYNLSYFLDSIPMKNGIEGIEHYGEIHTTLQNCLVHLIFMPFTIYGIITWFPIFVGLNKYQSIYFRRYIFILYIFHYLSIDIYTALQVFLLYLPFIYIANLHCILTEKDINSFIRGLCVSFVALNIQELFGHYLGGDKPSRVGSIPNAILYAPYNSIHGIKDIVYK